MNVRPDEPRWPDRDRLILSKGHAGPVLYTALAYKDYFPEAVAGDDEPERHAICPATSINSKRPAST